MLSTAFLSARYLSLSWARSIHFLPLYPTSWTPILILSWVFKVLFFPQVSPPKPCTGLCFPPYMLHAPLIFMTPYLKTQRQLCLTWG